MMSNCLIGFPNWLVYEKPRYSINLFVLQEIGVGCGGSFTKLDDCPTCVVAKVWE